MYTFRGNVALITPTGTALQSTERTLWKEASKMTRTKHDTRLCPEGCRFRNKAVPFCGYCLHKILKESEEERNANRETEAEHTE